MKNRSLIVAAVMSVLAAGAVAQTRVDRSGATDANNRVGSNGRNQVGGRQTPWDIQNNIVYGNVTGGKAFRGPTGSTDPQAFRGRTASENYDRFVRNSSGVTTGGLPTYNANETKAFYGDARGVNPPAGTVGVSTVGTYSPPSPTAWNPVDPRATALSSGVTTINRATDDTNISGGPVDTTYAPGARQIAPAASVTGNTNVLSDYTQLNMQGNVADTTPSQIKQNLGDQPDSRLPGQTPTNSANTLTPDAGAQQVPTGGNPVDNSQSGVTGNSGNPGTLAPGQNAVRTNALDPTKTPTEGTVTRFVNNAAGQPAADKPDARGTADAAAANNPNLPARPGQEAEEAARAYNAQRRAMNAKPDANAKPGDAKPGDANQPGAGQPAAGGNGPRAGGPNVDTTRGLNDLMGKAEAQMKEGKFATALDTYGSAEALAPRNGQIKLGRANAELGGAFYRRAEGTLRQAFSLDKNLLGARYDLRGLLGDDKLATIQKDLSDLVQNKPNDTGAALLLAYVYYNTGNAGRVAPLLDVADKRAGGQDQLIKSMKAAWSAGNETK